MDIVQKLRSQRTMSMFAKSEHLYEALNHDRREAADEIARLRAEIDNIKQVEFPRRVDKVADVWRNKCDLAESEIARLRDELTAARKTNSERLAANGPGGWINDLRDENGKLRADAERYRWLKARNSGSIGITTFNTDEALERVLVEGDADTEIDAAMQEGE